MKQANK